MEFWHSELIEKSQKLLFDLRKKIKFVLIGGWAVWLYTKQQKSKDIDIILKNISDIDFFKQNYIFVNKNEKLKKYEVKSEDVDIDIYVPFFSKLVLPVEEIFLYKTEKEGFETIIPEMLLILKQGAEMARQNTTKGIKDKIDILTLLCFAEIDFKKYNLLLEKYHLKHLRQRLKSIIKNFKEISYLGMNLRQFALKKKELLVKLVH